MRHDFERKSLIDQDLIHKLHHFFIENGEFVSVTKRLCWTKDMNWSNRIPGIYCFAETTGDVFDPIVFLYVGVSDDIHRRFCQHKHRWLTRYILDSKSDLYWGYIPESGLPADKQDFETACWRSKEQLGLYFEYQLHNGMSNA